MNNLRREWLDPESWLDLDDRYLSPPAADALLRWTLAEVDWEDKGDSRLLAWYGSFDYEYPGVSHQAREIPPNLAALLDEVTEYLANDAPLGFDGILLNRYDDGTDYVDFHADDEPSLRSAYPIAFLSLGQARVISFRPTARTVHPGYAHTLTHGSLLVAGGSVQERWHHAVPVEPWRQGVRVCLTFRKGA